MKARTLGTIWIGLVAGVMGFGGMEGILFYLLADMILSLVLIAFMGGKAKPYFTSLMQVAMTGLMGNVMTYIVIWVFAHNLVYVL